ncbi:hypothetical protein AB0I98_11000 [Streptomyces sp. NPDC050211]|uniref:hypothetical protein n=1 Tax=Streptomyces sp. NPDC050211 TaxID=3154932 RepID=UPI00341A00DD
MHVSRCVRAGGALGHLLLVVVLALGVFVMHTVGHPDESSHSSVSAMDTGSHTSAAMDPAQADPMQADPVQPASADMPLMAMDMASLCVAVLFAAWMLVAMLRSALARSPGCLADVLAQAPVLRRPAPPSRAPDLTQLSVLRQ